MGEVTEIEDFRWHKAKFARAFGMSRETVAKRFREAEVRPDGKTDGNDVYRLRDAAPALCGFQAGAGDTPLQDPNRMHPGDRRNWFLSEAARLQVELEQRHVIPDSEVQHEYALLAKLVTRHWRTLADVFERDNPGADQRYVQYLQDYSNTVLEDLADLVGADETEIPAKLAEIEARNAVRPGK